MKLGVCEGGGDCCAENCRVNLFCFMSVECTCYFTNMLDRCLSFSKLTAQEFMSDYLSLVTRYDTDDRGSIPGKGRYFALHCVQTECEPNQLPIQWFPE
jgi:hypothetical protein